MNICIVGAGWYGCHIASSLLKQGHDVVIFEKSASTISGASKKNQNRLHLGFHYPRNHETRVQSKNGFNWFIEHYGQLCTSVDENIYAVAKKDSYIDFETFKLIMEGTKLDFTEIERSEFPERGLNLDVIEGAILCQEMVINNSIATKYFDDILSRHLKLDTYVDLKNEVVVKSLKENFDYIIDCTWGTSGTLQDEEIFYEPCVYFYYKTQKEKRIAITVMDGEFCSLYPYYDDIYTLTSVNNTPLGQFSDINDAIVKLNNVKQNRALVSEKRDRFEEEIKSFYPNFSNEFEFIGPEFSMKTKVKSSTDYRGCFVKKTDKLISIFSGKIDTLYIAEKKVLEIISREN